MKSNELSIFYLIDLFKKRWWGIVISALIGATAAFCFSSFMVAPLYQSTAMMYVDPNIEDQQTIAVESASLNYAFSIIDTYIEILKSNAFMENVSKALNNRYTPEQLSKMITFTTKEKTKLFNVSVEASTPDDSLLIANTIGKLAPEMIINITDASVVSVADAPLKPEGPSNDNTGRNTVLGFVLGMALAIGVIIVIDMFDVRIKSEEDLINSYEIPVLGCIPNFEKIYRNKTQKSKAKPAAKAN
jgi:Capsular polysaccharide biosynthesis protein